MKCPGHSGTVGSYKHGIKKVLGRKVYLILFRLLPEALHKMCSKF